MKRLEMKNWIENLQKYQHYHHTKLLIYIKGEEIFPSDQSQLMLETYLENKKKTIEDQGENKLKLKTVKPLFQKMN